MIKKSFSKISLICCVILCALPILISAIEAGEYLVGIFGVPDGDWSILQKVGVNSLMIRENEINKTRSLSLNKIYVLGVNPPTIKDGLDKPALVKRFNLFKQLNDAYGYFIAGDMKCNNKKLVHDIKNLLNVKDNVIIGTLKEKHVECFPEYDVIFYYYPLMRRVLSLSDMLRQQVDTIKKANKRTFLYAQTHPQFWYKEIVKLGKMNKSALYYPDGQASRMMIYYAIATGCNGYFLYDHLSLSGEESRERVWASAQAILETRPLYQSIANLKDVEFFQKQNIYGTIIKGESYDIIFAFTSDIRAHYHPSTIPLHLKLKEFLNTSMYKSIYQYSPLETILAPEFVNVPQDHSLVLIAFKGKSNPETFKLNKEDIQLYLQILKSRTEQLTQNMKMMGKTTLPTFDLAQLDSKEKIKKLLGYLDQLNEIKRDAWLERVKGLPMEGEVLKDMYWNKKLSAPIKKGEVFNFYYNDSVR